jgi:outer membrane immunogenic protein
MFRFSALTLACVLTAMIALCSPAAATPTDNDRVLAMISALEARVTALENQNREYRRDAEQARAQAKVANDKLLKLTNPAPLARPVPADAMASYQVPERTSDWSGGYWGVSAGGAVSRSHVNQAEQLLILQPSGAFPFTINGQNMASSSGPSHGSGGIIDVFGGWNAQVASHFLLGGQLEATVSDIDFSSTGTRAYTYFNAAGATGQTGGSEFRPQVENRWMASALLRGGVLLDDKILVYGIGGWTIGQFEARNLTDNSFDQLPERFVANGGTAGGGIERKVDGHWSIRAEYRYTDFGRRSTRDQFTFQTAGVGFSGTQAYVRQGQFDQSMQVGRVGVAYALNPTR